MGNYLLLAAYAGILALLSGVALGGLDVAQELGTESLVSIVIIFNIVAAVMNIIFYGGFIVLGKKYERPYLVLGAVLVIVLAAISAIVTVVFLTVIPLTEATTDAEANAMVESFASSSPLFDYLLTTSGLLVFILAVIVIVIVIIIVKILFALSLKSLDVEGVPLAKTAGNLEIWSLVLMIIPFVGQILIIVTAIVEIIMFFKVAGSSATAGKVFKN